jgi:hypothetical protein
MSEWRTQAQIEADDQLSRAIGAALAAYSDDPEEASKFLLSEYIVITARAGISDDKAQHTKYDYCLANGSIPWHNMMGLMAWAKQTMMEQMAGQDSDDA